LRGSPGPCKCLVGARGAQVEACGLFDQANRPELKSCRLPAPSSAPNALSLATRWRQILARQQAETSRITPWQRPVVRAGAGGSAPRAR
jgi:hypothetical protein